MRRSGRLLLAISLFIAGITNAQSEGPGCLAESIPINTGWVGNATLPVGAGDPYWEVIADPDSGTGEPRPAFVINAHAAWKPALPNSMWISSYPGSANTTNGKYVFRYCFCLKEPFGTPVLNLSLRADDQADVFLNNTKIGSTPDPSFNTAAPTTINQVPPGLFTSGKNCITVELNNTGSVAMGLNLAGMVAANGVAVLKPECCNPGAKIQGRKWNDANGNGTLDSGETGLPGWTISLSNGMTATTDSLGYYNFTGVPAGPVTISEAQQGGWQQTFPSGGTYAVTVSPTSVVAGKDFGNRKGGDEMPACSLCGDFNSSCCLGRNAQGQAIYSFLITINYQPLTSSGACPLTLVPAAGTVLSYSPQVLVPGNNTISGTIAISGTPPSPFCFKVKCGGTEGCVGAVCTKLLPACDRQ